jgi:CRP/FNR family transcriptional regulator
MFINEELCHLATEYPTKRFQKKQHLYLSSSTTKNLYLILYGSCKEYYINDEGDEIVRAFYFAGDIIGLDKLNHENAIFNVSTLENTKVAIIPENALHHQDFMRACLIQLSINEKEQSLLLSAPGLRARVATFFISYINNHLSKHGSDRHIILPITMVELSKYLNITNESLSRFLAKLKKNKTLIIKKHVICHYNLSQLKAIANIAESPEVISKTA